MESDPLKTFVDRFVPRGVPSARGPFAVLRRQALAELRALVTAERADQRREDADWLARRAGEEEGGRRYALAGAAAALRAGGGRERWKATR
jgi:hypothetical protein